MRSARPRNRCGIPPLRWKAPRDQRPEAGRDACDPGSVAEHRPARDGSVLPAAVRCKPDPPVTSTDTDDPASACATVTVPALCGSRATGQTARTGPLSLPERRLQLAEGKGSRAFALSLRGHTGTLPRGVRSYPETGSVTVRLGGRLA